jgi:hypothetical protein
LRRYLKELVSMPATAKPEALPALIPAIDLYHRYLKAGRLGSAFQLAWPKGREDDGLFRRLEDAGCYALVRELAEPVFDRARPERQQVDSRKYVAAEFLGRAQSSLGELAAARATHLEALEGFESFGRMQREPSGALALLSLELGDIASFLHWTGYLSRLGSNRENSIPLASSIIGVALLRLHAISRAGVELFTSTEWPALRYPAAEARIAVGDLSHPVVGTAIRAASPTGYRGEARYAHLVSALWHAARSEHAAAVEAFALAAASAGDVGDVAFHVRVLTERARAASRAGEPVGDILNEALAMVSRIENVLVIHELYEVARTNGVAIDATFPDHAVGGNALRTMKAALLAGLPEFAAGLVRRWTRLCARGELAVLEREADRFREVASDLAG